MGTGKAHVPCHKRVPFFLVGIFIIIAAYKHSERIQREEESTIAVVSLKASSTCKLPARGQHLSLDLSGSSFKTLSSEKLIRDATLEIIKHAGLKVLDIHSHKLNHQGISLAAMLEDSQLTIQTWPEHGKAIVDLISRRVEINMQNFLPIVVEGYRGDLSKSTFSIIPRGGEDTNNDDNENCTSSDKEDKDDQLEQHQFEPYEIMGQHKFKKKVFEKQSPFQHIALWDHHLTLDDDYHNETTRSLFLDGVMQSNIHDEEQYHESLVHPAFVASSVPPKRVLIVGGGEGGTLRETLKWSSVERVTMVDLDADVVRASREYLPSYSNCTGFGTVSCFDDKRLELYTEDFIGWFDKKIGNDICEKQFEEKKDLLYDIVIIDLLDTEELPDGEEWAKHLYSDMFFKRIACAVTTYGIVVTNFGEAPEYFDGGPPTPKTELDRERLQMFLKKMKQMRTMSRFFRDTRIYNTYIESYRGQWSYAIGIVPDVSAMEVKLSASVMDRKVSELNYNGASGIQYFEGSPDRVDLKLKDGLKDKAYPLEFYNGMIQHGFQYPTADWTGVLCSDPEIRRICDVPKDSRAGNAKKICVVFDAFMEEIITRNPPSKICSTFIK